VRKPSRWWVQTTFVLAVTLTLGLGIQCIAGDTGMEGLADAQTSSQPTQAPASGVQRGEAITVSTNDIQRSILVTGELKASTARDIIAPRVRSQFGTSITFMALEGTAVKKGDRILEFDATTLVSQKAEAERVLDEAKLKIEKTRADLEVQRADLLIALSAADANLKVAQLYGKIEKALLPANTWQKYQLDLAKAQLAKQRAQEQLANLVNSIPAQVALVEVSKAQAEVGLRKIEGDLAQMSIDAPQDGIIIYGDNWASSRKFQVGDNAFPGMPVMTIPDLSTIQVVAYVYDTELRFLSPNMTCNLGLDSVPERSYRGRIISLTSVANRKGFASQHKVFRAVIDLDRLDSDVMKPGMTVKVEVPVSLASGVISVPREYIGVDPSGGYYVLKGAESKSASAQAIQVGVYGDRLVQISSGVNVGDRLLPVQKSQELNK